MLEAQSVVVEIRRGIKASHLGAAVYVADTARRAQLKQVQLGTGAVPLHELLGFLKGQGFDGWLYIEGASAKGRPVGRGAGRTTCARDPGSGMTVSRSLSRKVRCAQHRREL